MKTYKNSESVTKVWDGEFKCYRLVNQDITNKTNDVAVNNSKGYIDMSLGNGNDTYVIENIANGSVTIFDGSYTENRVMKDENTYSDIPNPDKDTLIIQNIKPSDLCIYFDVSIAKYDGTNESDMADDSLYIMKRDLVDDIFYKASTIADDSILEKELKGLIIVEDQFGTTNNGGNKVGSGYISCFKTEDQSGERILNIDRAISRITNNVKEFLERGIACYDPETDSYFDAKTSWQVLNYAESDWERNYLMDIYKEQMIYSYSSDGSELLLSCSEHTGTTTINSTDKINTIRIEDVINISSKDKILQDFGIYLSVNPKNKNNLLFKTYCYDENCDCENSENTIEIKDYFKTLSSNPVQDLVLVSESGQELKLNLYNLLNKTPGTPEASYVARIEITSFDKPGKIEGTQFDDWIDGSDGNDTIFSGAGNDIVAANGGNDIIYSESGNNIYEFGDNTDYFDSPKFDNKGKIIFMGDGQDVLYSQSKENAKKFSDTIHFENLNGFVDKTKTFTSPVDGYSKAITTKADMSFGRKGNDLLIYYGELKADKTSDNYVVLKDYLENPDNSSFKNLVIAHYCIWDYETNSVYYRDYEEVKMTLSEAIKKYMTVSTEPESNTKPKPTLPVDIVGTNKGETLKGNSNDNVITGKGGNDKLYGIAGNNTFVFNANDGEDTVYSQTAKKGVSFGKDTLKFAADTNVTSLSNLTFYTIKNDLVIGYKGGNIKLSNYMKNPTASSIQKIVDANGNDLLGGKTLAEKLNAGAIKFTYDYSNSTKAVKVTGTQFADSIKGGSGNDTLNGAAGNDTIEGGKGKDKLYGVSGNNTFVFNANDGEDTVYSQEAKGGTTIGVDTLKFNDPKVTSLSNLSFFPSTNGKDLIIGYTGGKVTLANYMKNPTASSIQKIVDANGNDLLAGNTLAKILQNNLITFNYDNSASKKAVKVTGTQFDDIIKGGSAKDTLVGGAGNDIIYGGAGNDTIKGGKDNDIIISGADNDKLYGEFGNNKFVFNKGDGSDIVYSQVKNKTNPTIGTDMLVFDNSLKGKLSYEKLKNDLVITYGKNDKVTLANYFKNASNSVKDIAFADTSSIDSIKSAKSSGTIVKGVNTTAKDDNGKDFTYTKYAGNDDSDHLVIANEKISLVSTGNGNDTIIVDSNNAYVSGGGGNDKYIVSSLQKETIIDDRSGNDTIYLSEKKNNLKFIFELHVDKNGKIINTVDSFNDEFDSGSDLEIYTSANRNKMLNTKSDIDVKNCIIRDAYASIENGSAKTIVSNDGYQITSAKLQQIAQNLAGWLSDRGFSSSYDVAESGSANDFKQAMAYMDQQFNQAWEKIK